MSEAKRRRTPADNFKRLLDDAPATARLAVRCGVFTPQRNFRD
jgi:hypothetical protein